MACIQEALGYPQAQRMKQPVRTSWCGPQQIKKKKKFKWKKLNLHLHNANGLFKLFGEIVQGDWNMARFKN